MLNIAQAQAVDEIATIRAMMREYQQALGVDLSFQGFDAELGKLPGSYAPPDGRLLLARVGGEAVGCVALQRIDASRCEMKRLYVRSGARGLGAGKALIARVLDEARAIGYVEVVLDTLPTMSEAQRLYEQLGFHEIHAYRANPIQGTRYLAKALR